MIKFFRNIRKSLFEKGNLRKYSLYAIGEIILVVVGILIALQINNWNESNIEAKTGIEYLERIKTDLVKDTVYLNERIQLAINEQKSFKLFINSMYNELTREDFSKLLSSVLWDRTNLVIEDKSYVEMTNSGKFGYIENINIRNRIMDYYKNYTLFNLKISEMNDTGGEMFTRTIYMRMMEYWPIFRTVTTKESMINDLDWKFINNPDSQGFKDLKSVSFYYWFKQTISEDYYKELKADAKELIKDIENEIDHEID